MKNLFKRKPKYTDNIREMKYMSSVKKGDVETIVHGNEFCQIEIEINRETGFARIIADKDINISNEDIIYLMETYI